MHLFVAAAQYYFKIVVTPDSPFTSQDSKLARPMRRRARADVVPCVRVFGGPSARRATRSVGIGKGEAHRRSRCGVVFGLTCLGAAALFGNGHEVVASSKERQGHT